jgi:hypothetical protein
MPLEPAIGYAMVVFFLRISSIMTTIPTHVNGFYLPTCANGYLRTDKTQQNHKKHPKELKDTILLIKRQEHPHCSNVYMFTCVHAQRNHSLQQEINPHQVFNIVSQCLTNWTHLNLYSSPNWDFFHSPIGPVSTSCPHLGTFFTH